VHATFLSGFVWGENIGWINLGDGTPADGVRYANLTGADFGVNLGASGEFSGLAWGENVGWINFRGGALATPPNPARLDVAAARFRGYAWGENIGWINLDHDTHYVGVLGACACNSDGVTNSQDFFDFLTCFFAGCAEGAEASGRGGVDGGVEA
jgi:hypothetical protein